MTRCVLLSREEHAAREKARHTAIGAWQAAHPEVDTSKGWPAELSALNDTFFPPGTMWFCPWYHDPSKPSDMERIPRWRENAKEPGHQGHLSIHYLTDWAHIRPPICVVCPGGTHWIPDAKSTNGTGWTVTGEAPNITASPSIWAGQGSGAPREYHGFLNNGVFSAPV